MKNRYINYIKSEGCEISKERGLYKLKNYIVRLLIGDDGRYLDSVLFRCTDEITWGNFGWILATLDEFINAYYKIELSYIEHQVRRFGEPKLTKPEELRHVSALFSVDYIKNKCKCQVYVNGNDVWIKHRDYFSPSLQVDPEDIGTSLEYRAKKYLNKDMRRKFDYDDMWGDIVLRNEAWICLKNLAAIIKRDGIFRLKYKILALQEEALKFEKFSLITGNMECMWDDMLIKLEKALMPLVK